MKSTPTALLLMTVAMNCTVNAEETKPDETQSALNSDWSFGLQAAPSVFGLSLRYQANNQWQLQAVLDPSDDELAFAARVLRTSTQKKYWQSYLFAGLAGEQDSDYPNFSSNGAVDYRKSVATLGLGVEWAWAAKNPSLPPLAWSLELGLGHSTKNWNSNSVPDSSQTFLAFGLGIHYRFQQ